MPQQNKTITCKYLTFYFNKQWRFFPLIKINLGHTETTKTLALIDSGATNTFIPRGIADAIGVLDDKDKIRTSDSIGASGKFKTDYTKLNKMELLKGEIPFDIFRSIYVHIPGEKEEDLPYVILGRDYIFKRYDISIYENRKKITFTRHK